MQAWLGVMISGMAGEPIDFNRDIRPMLSDKCFFCHGPDEAERKAELRLDTPTGAFLDLGGYAARKKGSLEESELWARIITEDEEDLMPPLDSGKSLSSGEKEQIKQWVKQFFKETTQPQNINNNDFENMDQRGRSREAIKETETAISRVISGEKRVELMAQPPYVRRLQHGLAARNNLGSASTGREPSRRVVIRRRKR